MFCECGLGVAGFVLGVVEVVEAFWCCGVVVLWIDWNSKLDTEIVWMGFMGGVGIWSGEWVSLFLGIVGDV